MAEPTAKIGTVHGPGDPASISASRFRDARYIDPVLLRPPKRLVYLYTISKRDFVVSQPPLFPKLFVPACEPDQSYRLVATIPDPMLQADMEVWSEDIRVHGHNGCTVAQSLCNPDNYAARDYADSAEDTRAIITLQDALPTGGLGWGVNLNVQGVFWSLHNPPQKEEIAAAERRRERYYSRLIEQARQLELSDPRKLNDELNQDYHQAAEYFNLETSWHKTLIKRAECPLCGQGMKPGVAIHALPDGCGGVLDWDRAIAAGLRKAADRPK
jgi:hypothetical protein